jgi:hypothetical protein
VRSSSASFATEGIQAEPSAPYTPQYNGISERCNRTVMDPTRSMLDHAGMPNSTLSRSLFTLRNAFPPALFRILHPLKPGMVQARSLIFLIFASLDLWPIARPLQ